MAQTNGAPDATPVEPAGRLRWYHGLTGYHWLVLIVASCGWLFDTMDQWLYNLAKGPALATLLGPGASSGDVLKWSGWCTAVMLLGWATGGFVFGMIGDKLGRTRTMILTVLLYAIFTGLSGLAQTPLQFAVCRFLTGLGIGGEFAAGAALVAETFPDHARATGLGIMQASSAIGNMLAGLVNLTIGSLAVANPVPGHEPWRYVFYVGIVPALLTVIVRLWVKEPDKWHEARAAATESKRLGSLADLFRGPVLRRSTFVCIGLGAVGVIGFWGIATWSPDLLRGVLNPDKLPELRAATEKSVSLAQMAQNAGAFFGILGWTWLAQRAGRRAAFAATFLSCFIVVPTTFLLTQHFATFTAALILFPIMGFCTTSVFGGFAIYFPELYPTRLRATGTGVGYNVARYLAIAGPMTLGGLSKQFGLHIAATMVSSVFLLGLLILLWAPETKGRPLPEDL